MIEKPVWVKTNKVEKPGLYLDGNFGEKPCTPITCEIFEEGMDLGGKCWLAYLGPVPIPEMPQPDLKIDDPVIVWDYVDDCKTQRRYFAGWGEDGRITTWAIGKTSWTAYQKTTWNHYRLPTTEELKKGVKNG
jgi:hypothetical protein